MSKVNLQLRTYSRQSSVGGIKEGFSGDIILRSEPFPFHNPPQGLNNIQVSRVWWNVEEKESPFLPHCAHSPYFLITMYTGIVKHDKCLPSDFEREVVKKFNHFLGIYRFRGAKSLETIIPVNHAKDVQAFGLFNRSVHLLSGKLPSIRHISFGTNMGLITIKEINFSFLKESFKFLQLLGFINIELRRGPTLRTFPYMSIYCANADKQRLNVDLLPSLP